MVSLREKAGVVKKRERFQCINIEFLTVTRPTKHTFFPIPKRVPRISGQKKDDAEQEEKKIQFLRELFQKCA